MCSSKVTLFYGLWVKTWSLVFAAKAHKKAAPTLLAIDLILHRRRTGQLKVKQRVTRRRNVSDLPEEIWAIVKQVVIDEALADAEEFALSDNRCKSCEVALGESSVWGESDLEGEGSKPKALSKVWTEWDDPVCKECVEVLDECYGGFIGLEVEEQTIGPLLRHFGLCLPDKILFRDDPEVWLDFGAVSALAIPLRCSSSPSYPIAEAPMESENGLTVQHSTVFALDPRALHLPSSAELRFRRLISTYRLQVDDPTKATIVPALSSHESAPSTPIGAQKKAAETTAEESFDKRSPRWMLWSVGCLCT